MTFPTAVAWHVNLGSGAPSNVVIADGMIFLTTGTSGGSQLLALSQSNGGDGLGPGGDFRHPRRIRGCGLRQ